MPQAYGALAVRMRRDGTTVDGIATKRGKATHVLANVEPGGAD